MNLLNEPTHYRLPWSRFEIAPDWQRSEIVATSFDERRHRWAVREAGAVLNKEGEWEREPNPSERMEDFIERTRWETPEEAAEAARKFFTSSPSKYATS